MVKSVNSTITEHSTDPSLVSCYHMLETLMCVLKKTQIFPSFSIFVWRRSSNIISFLHQRRQSRQPGGRDLIHRSDKPSTIELSQLAPQQDLQSPSVTDAISLPSVQHHNAVPSTSSRSSRLHHHVRQP